MTDACTPDEKVPSLQSTNSGLARLAEEATELYDAQERLMVRQRMLVTKVRICAEFLSSHLPPGTGKAPDRRFPELNHEGD